MLHKRESTSTHKRPCVHPLNCLRGGGGVRGFNQEIHLQGFHVSRTGRCSSSRFAQWIMETACAPKPRSIVNKADAIAGSVSAVRSTGWFWMQHVEKIRVAWNIPLPVRQNQHKQVFRGSGGASFEAAVIKSRCKEKYTVGETESAEAWRWCRRSRAGLTSN